MRDFAPTKGGLNLRYEIRGKGYPLLLIQGFAGSSRSWSEPFLTLIEKRFRTVIFDNRGTGESDKPDMPWTMTDMADDVAAVLDHVGIDRAHIYGISMGGLIAQEFTLKHPARVRGLVLGCTACGRNTMRNPENIGKLTPDPGKSSEENLRLIFSLACGTAFLNSKRGQDFIEQQIVETMKYPATPLHTYNRQREAIEGWDSYDRLSQIKAPTIIIHGDGDRLLLPANAEILRSRIAGSKVHIMKGVGHLFFWEEPQEAVRVPGDFVVSAM